MRERWQTQEYQDKHRAASIGRVPSEQQRAKASASNRGQKRSKEACEKFSTNTKALWTDESFRAKQVAARTGKKHSDETRAKMRASQQARIEAAV